MTFGAFLSENLTTWQTPVVRIEAGVTQHQPQTYPGVQFGPPSKIVSERWFHVLALLCQQQSSLTTYRWTVSKPRQKPLDHPSPKAAHSGLCLTSSTQF